MASCRMMKTNFCDPLWYLGHPNFAVKNWKNCRKNLKKLPKIALTKKSSRKRQFILKTAVYVLKTATFVPNGNFFQTMKNFRKLFSTVIYPQDGSLCPENGNYYPKTAFFVPTIKSCRKLQRRDNRTQNLLANEVNCITIKNLWCNKRWTGFKCQRGNIIYGIVSNDEDEFLWPIMIPRATQFCR